MATPLIKVTHNGVGRVINRRLPISSLPRRGPERSSSLPLKTAASPLALQHRKYHSSIYISYTNSASYNQCYSTRTIIGSQLRHSLFAGESNLQHNHHTFLSTTTIVPKRPFSSSSFLDKLKKQARTTAKSVAEKASKTAKKTAQTATGLASEALESTKKVVQTAGDKTMKRVSETASKAKQTSAQKLSDATANLKKATSQALQSSVDGATKQISAVASTAKKSTTESIAKSTKAIESGVEQQTKAATQKVETIREDASQKVETIKESSKQVKDGLLGAGTKALRWFWWWSLAAIFVYGVASNLPMAIIKYTIKEKKEKYDNKTTKGGSGEIDDEREPQSERTIRTDDIDEQRFEGQR